MYLINPVRAASRRLFYGKPSAPALTPLTCRPRAPAFDERSAPSVLVGMMLLVRLSPRGPTEPLLVCASRETSQSNASISAGKANCLRQLASECTLGAAPPLLNAWQERSPLGGQHTDDLTRQQSRGPWHVAILPRSKVFNRF